MMVSGCWRKSFVNGITVNPSTEDVAVADFTSAGKVKVYNKDGDSLQS